MARGVLRKKLPDAVAESFFATLKVELAHTAQWLTRAQAQDDVFEYVEGFYNGQRRHSALGYLSPVTFERHWATASLPLSRSAAERAVPRRSHWYARGARGAMRSTPNVVSNDPITAVSTRAGQVQVACGSR